MSGIAKIACFWPESANDELGELIQWGENCQLRKDPCTHIAVVLPDCYMEAVWYGVALSPLNKYDHRKHEIWGIEVPFPEMSEAAVDYHRHFRYGYKSCFCGLMRDRFGIKIPYIPTHEENCSQVGTGFIAWEGLRLFGLDNPAGITPMDLRDKFMELKNICRLLEKNY